LDKVQQYRYKIVIEYDGGDFVGWQRQRNGVSIQQVLEEAIYRLSGEESRAFASGRTDAGVHARGQVAHFDLTKFYDNKTIVNALNYHMRPYPVVILTAQQVDDSFHARFSAQKRYYCYKICNRSSPPALDAKRMWHIIPPINPEKMQEAAFVLQGTHDFTSFRALQCQAKSPVKTIDYIKVTANAEQVITIDFAAKSFLHHMVRNIVGTLQMVGTGKIAVAEVGNILAARDRCAAGITAPAHGLYFIATDY